MTFSIISQGKGKIKYPCPFCSRIFISIYNNWKNGLKSVIFRSLKKSLAFKAVRQFSYIWGIFIRPVMVRKYPFLDPVGSQRRL
jgi:hypothetical protein